MNKSCRFVCLSARDQNRPPCCCCCCIIFAFSSWNRAPTRSECFNHFCVQFSTHVCSLLLNALLVKSLQQLSKHLSTKPVYNRIKSFICFCSMSLCMACCSPEERLETVVKRKKSTVRLCFHHFVLSRLHSQSIFSDICCDGGPQHILNARGLCFRTQIIFCFLKAKIIHVILARLNFISKKKARQRGTGGQRTHLFSTSMA